jgi:DnaJ like chaperone protein
MAYLADVAAIFGIDDAAFERISARHVIPGEGDPYAILGIDRSLPIVEIRARYRALAAENHPDRLIARGVPPQAAAIAHERMAAINFAWQRIQLERR